MEKIGENLEISKSEYNKALEYYKEALIIKQQLFEPEHLSISDSYMYIGDYDKAMMYVNDSYVIKTKKLGENHIEISKIIKLLKRLYTKLGDYDFTLKYQRKGLKILQNTHGKYHKDIANYYDSLAASYYLKKNYGEAFSHIKTAIAIWKKVSKNDIPPNYYITIGNICAATYRSKEALEYFKTSIELTKKTFGEKHIWVLINNYNIALFYHSIKEYDLAIKQLKKTLIFGENILGKDHFELARCYKLMGNIYKEKKEYDKASHFLNKALLMTKKGLRVCLT